MPFLQPTWCSQFTSIWCTIWPCIDLQALVVIMNVCKTYTNGSFTINMNCPIYMEEVLAKSRLHKTLPLMIYGWLSLQTLTEDFGVGGILYQNLPWAPPGTNFIFQHGVYYQFSNLDIEYLFGTWWSSMFKTWWQTYGKNP